jgi:hypothetical protein
MCACVHVCMHTEGSPKGLRPAGAAAGADGGEVAPTPALSSAAPALDPICPCAPSTFEEADVPSTRASLPPAVPAAFRDAVDSEFSWPCSVEVESREKRTKMRESRQGVLGLLSTIERLAMEIMPTSSHECMRHALYENGE